MASIERTAYPRFKRNPLVKELDALYTPTDDELGFARVLARKAQPRFGLLLLLKAFQRLGYFPAVEEIPPAIVQHVRATSRVDAEVSPIYAEMRTLYRHHQPIRERLGVSAWGDHGLGVASEAMSAAAEVMDNPADLINVAISGLLYWSKPTAASVSAGSTSKSACFPPWRQKSRLAMSQTLWGLHHRCRGSARADRSVIADLMSRAALERLLSIKSYFYMYVGCTRIWPAIPPAQ